MCVVNAKSKALKIVLFVRSTQSAFSQIRQEILQWRYDKHKRRHLMISSRDLLTWISSNLPSVEMPIRLILPEIVHPSRHSTEAFQQEKSTHWEPICSRIGVGGNVSKATHVFLEWKSPRLLGRDSRYLIPSEQFHVLLGKTKTRPTSLRRPPRGITPR